MKTRKERKMSRMPKYSSNVAWSEEDGVYVAVSAEFPGLSGLGTKPEEAVRELQVAVDLAVETLEEEGRALPEPNLIGEYSGQFRLRLPKSLHQALALRAHSEGVSLNTLAVTFLSQGLASSVARLHSTQEYQAVIRDLQVETERVRRLFAAVMVNFRGASSTAQYQDPLLNRLYAGESVNLTVDQSVLASTTH